MANNPKDDSVRKPIEVIQVRGGLKHVRPDPSPPKIITLPSSQIDDARPKIVFVEDESQDYITNNVIQSSESPENAPDPASINLSYRSETLITSPESPTDPNSPRNLQRPIRPFNTQGVLPCRKSFINKFTISFGALVAGVGAFFVGTCHDTKENFPPAYTSPIVSLPPLSKIEDKIFTCTDDSIEFQFKLEGIGTSQYVAAMVSTGWNNQNLLNLCSKSLDEQTVLVETYNTKMFQSFLYDNLQSILDLTKEILTANEGKVYNINLENLKDGRNNVVQLNETFEYPLPDSLEQKVQSEQGNNLKIKSRGERLEEASRLYLNADPESSDYKTLSEIVREIGISAREIKEYSGVTRFELRHYQLAQRREDIWREFMELGSSVNKSEFVRSKAQEYNLSDSTIYRDLRIMSLEVPEPTNLEY